MGWAGPVCTRNLADLGADVIKIEACGYPDWWRGVDNRIETVTQRLYEKSHRFNIMNRGKRAITLDLTVPQGVALAKALVKNADAVIENYSAEVLRKFGLDYPELIKVNPSLVMVSMAAFGSNGAVEGDARLRLHSRAGLRPAGRRRPARRPADDEPSRLRRCRRRPQCLLVDADRVAPSQADGAGPVHRSFPGPVHAAVHGGLGDRAVGDRPRHAPRRQPSSALQAARRVSIGRYRQMGVRGGDGRRHVDGTRAGHPLDRPARTRGRDRTRGRCLDVSAVRRRGDGHSTARGRGSWRGTPSGSS